MNNRMMAPELVQKLFQQAQIKLDQANGSETFMLCMAVGRGLNRKFKI
jgi:hypothetical protein